MSYEDGVIELATSGSNDYIYPPYGKVIGIATRHTEIDADTKVVTSTLIPNFVVAGEVIQQVDTGVVEVIDCPKRTAKNRENLRNLRKFIKSITVIFRQPSNNCRFNRVSLDLFCPASALFATDCEQGGGQLRFLCPRPWRYKLKRSSLKNKVQMRSWGPGNPPK